MNSSRLAEFKEKAYMFNKIKERLRNAYNYKDRHKICNGMLRRENRVENLISTNLSPPVQDLCIFEHWSKEAQADRDLHELSTLLDGLYCCCRCKCLLICLKHSNIYCKSCEYCKTGAIVENCNNKIIKYSFILEEISTNDKVITGYKVNDTGKVIYEFE